MELIDFWNLKSSQKSVGNQLDSGSLECDYLCCVSHNPCASGSYGRPARQAVKQNTGRFTNHTVRIFTAFNEGLLKRHAFWSVVSSRVRIL